MKKINLLYMVIMVCMLMLLPEKSRAGQLEIHPRIETGIMDLTIKYGNISESNIKSPGQRSGYNMVRKGWEYQDQMPLAGGGVTLSYNRLFVDLSGQYAYDGDASYTSQISTYDEDFNASDDDGSSGMAMITSSDGIRRARFDYNARSVAAGYAINPDLSIFVGYRWADVDIDEQVEGTIYTVASDVHAWVKSIHRTASDISLKYEGPFIGAKSGWEIDAWGFFKGVVTLKIGLAYLTSKYSHLHNFWIYHDFNDTEKSSSEYGETKGETWGFALGLGWHGSTLVRNLTYAFKIDGYRYNFNNDDKALGDISGSALTYRAELAYAF